MFNVRRNYSLGLLLEQYGPAFAAAIALASLFYYSQEIAMNFSSEKWKSSGLYAAIFGWSSIQVGFSFGVFGFVLGKSDGFVKEIRGTKAMARFLSYIKRANIAGFILTISSIPLVVIEPTIREPIDFYYIFIAIWFSLFVWSFFSFLRIAYNFGRIASVKDKEFHGA